MHGGSTKLSSLKMSRAETPADYLDDPIGVDLDSQNMPVNRVRADLITVQDQRNPNATAVANIYQVSSQLANKGLTGQRRKIRAGANRTTSPSHPDS